MTEEFSHLRKSKPVVVASGIIWMVVAITATSNGVPYNDIKTHTTIIRQSSGGSKNQTKSRTFKRSKTIKTKTLRKIRKDTTRKNKY